MIEFKMPSLGADMEAGTLREWLKKPGDTVKRGDLIAVVETQKGLIDIEVFEEGTIDSLLLKVEDKVPVGAIMALINATGESREKKTELKSEVKVEASQEDLQPIEEKISLTHTTNRIKASPLAKSIAAANNVDLTEVQGTGENGAITKEDVENAMARSLSSPKTNASASTESIRMAVAAAMSKSNREIPHYYLELRVDMTKALAWLAETNRQSAVKNRLLPAALFVKAVAKSLLEVPELNAVWDNGLVLKQEINIGFIVSLRAGGVMIPAMLHADKKSVSEIMESLNDLIPRARNLKLKSSELSESTITITNLGEGGADKVFGVIYPPQVAILGFGSTVEQPWAEHGMLAVRPVNTITLAGDHRATDGHTGSRLLVAINNHLQKPEEL
jgi:pyruvate dehydrogenase E2 component (dihydrolipoamide acetyltransferase)